MVKARKLIWLRQSTLAASPIARVFAGVKSAREDVRLFFFGFY